MRVGNRAARLLLFLFITAAYLIPPSETARLQSELGPGAVFTVTNSNDSGAESFRQAIIDANAATGTDTIQFQIGSGPVNINLSTSLPDITEPLNIDGTTQPGFSGTPLIRLAGNFTVGLKITGGGSTVKALGLTGFVNGVQLENAGGNIVTGCFIGICPQDPTAACGNFENGILINNSPNNQIGGSTAATRNIISGNTFDGIEITGAASSGNIITGNHIGLRADGTVARNNDSGISLNGAANNRVGGTTPGERNVISGNGQGSDLPGNQFKSGVLISGATASGNVVEGNYIGTTIDGTATVPGGSRLNGVRIDNAPNNTIGGMVGTTPDGACTGACNVISGILLRGGVVITGSGATGNSVLGNFIGTNATGTGTIANNVGVTITAAAANNTVGGTTAPARNLIPNGMILTAGAATNTVQGNYIGTDTTGNIGIGTGTLFPNILVAVGIDSSPNNRIGMAAGTTLGGACTGGCNLISGNGAAHGVFITGAGSTGNRVDYNYIGLNAAGTTALRNGGDAITLRNGSNNNIIGRPLTATPFQSKEDCAENNAPQTLRCIKDDFTGDWIQFDDATGEYTWSNCRGGVTMSGIGEVTINGNDVRLRSPAVGIAIDTGLGRGAATIVPPSDSFLQGFLLQDRDMSDSTCDCPTEGMQIVLGTVANGINNDPNPPTNNKFNRLSVGWDASGVFRRSTPTEDGYFQNRAGNFNSYTNLDIATNGGNFPPVSVRSGTDIFLGTLKINALDPGIYANLPFDLHDDGSVNPPVLPQPGPGANRSYNSPQNLRVRREANGGVRVSGTLYLQAGTGSRLGVRGVEDLGGGMKAVFNNEHRFDVVPDANGNATIDKLYTGVDAVALKQSDYLAATATRINQVPVSSANSATSFVEVLGDTSEFSLPAVVPRPKFDFDEDGKTDIAIYRPGAAADDFSYWYILNSNDFTFRVVQFGSGEDKIVAGDYQGDGIVDFAIFRPSNGTWYFSRIAGDPPTNFVGVQWGVSTDIPVPGDYDDDGANDAAIFRPSDGTWWIRRSIDGSFFVQQWGLATDTPAPADYDGDGDTDIAVYRNGTWYISTCPNCLPVYSQFGLAGDVPVPGDYDGDGRDDVAVWRPSTGVWYFNRSTAGFTAVQWGIATDTPLNGDFDADGKNDIAIWRPSTGDWWILKSSDAGVQALHWGQNGDIPVPRFQNSP